MAENLNPSKGSIVIGPLNVDWASQSIKGSQAVDNVTPYDTSHVMVKNIGSGTPGQQVTVGGFAVRGTNVPGLGLGNNTNLAATSTNFVWNATGLAATFQLDSGITESGEYILQDLSVSQKRMSGATPIAATLMNQWDVAEAWAETTE